MVFDASARMFIARLGNLSARVVLESDGELPYRNRAYLPAYMATERHIPASRGDFMPSDGSTTSISWASLVGIDRPDINIEGPGVRYFNAFMNGVDPLQRFCLISAQRKDPPYNTERFLADRTTGTRVDVPQTPLTGRIRRVRGVSVDGNWIVGSGVLFEDNPSSFVDLLRHNVAAQELIRLNRLPGGQRFDIEDEPKGVSVSADSSKVLIQTRQPLAPRVPENVAQLYQLDIPNMRFTLVSADSLGAPSESNVKMGGMSLDGRYVTFSTSAGLVVGLAGADPIPSSARKPMQAYVRDMQTGVTRLVSTKSGRVLANVAELPEHDWYLFGAQAMAVGDDGATALFEDSRPMSANPQPVRTGLYVHTRDWVSRPAVVQRRESNGAIAWQAFQPGMGALGWGTGPSAPAGATLLAATDFNKDKSDDLVFRTAQGFEIWLQDGYQTRVRQTFAASPGWTPVSAGDLDGDGFPELVQRRNSDGRLGGWTTRATDPSTVALQRWFTLPRILPGAKLVALTDLDHDGKNDLLIETPDRRLAAYLMDGIAIKGWRTISRLGSGWSPRGVGDFSGDGKPDVLLAHTNGSFGAWTLVGGTITGWRTLSHGVPGYTVLGVATYL